MNKLIALFIVFSIVSCREARAPIDLDYCKILNQDQTLNGQERKDIFKENFDLVLAYTRENGFPKYNFNALPKDSCKTWALTATLVHIAQSAPELMFNSKVIDLFEQEIKKENLDPENLYTAFKVSTGGGKIFCDSLKTYIDLTFDKWDMDPALKEDFKFKKCAN